MEYPHTPLFTESVKQEFQAHVFSSPNSSEIYVCLYILYTFYQTAKWVMQNLQIVVLVCSEPAIHKLQILIIFYIEISPLRSNIASYTWIHTDSAFPYFFLSLLNVNIMIWLTRPFMVSDRNGLTRLKTQSNMDGSFTKCRALNLRGNTSCESRDIIYY